MGFRRTGPAAFAQFRSDTEFSSIFGPDLKLLASLEARPDDARIDWRHLVLSIQQTAKLPFERQHRILLPILEQILRRMEAGGLLVVAATFTSDKPILNDGRRIPYK